MWGLHPQAHNVNVSTDVLHVAVLVRLLAGEMEGEGEPPEREREREAKLEQVRSQVRRFLIINFSSSCHPCIGSVTWSHSYGFSSP